MAVSLRLCALFAGFLMINAGCTALKTNTTDTLGAIDLKPYGRFQINQQQELELVSSAVNFGFAFEGEECVINVKGDDPKGHNYLQYELDGVYQKRIRTEGDVATPLVIKVAGKGKHKIWIYKATEAHSGTIKVLSVSAKNIRPISRPALPLIEFIGNSITCGAAADDSEVACGTGEYHDQHNAYLAYGPRLARALNTNFIMSSVSGIGIYRNWAGDGAPMPRVYEYLKFGEGSGPKWDFSRYSPRIVSIALGTNDLSNGDGKTPRKPFDTTICINSYVKFIQLVKSKYPKARIVLLNSPMAGGEPAKLLDQCIASVKQKVDVLYPSDFPVSTYFFKPMQARGCTGHPSVADHEILAKQLEPFFRKLLF
uniref:SGNH/GDSL hydrolase family protein n=1 Tax=Pedobacter schmidteae TaxID=2201271 RepID=UPI000EB561F8|nr:SGNH/GDSL hydrolase family protein [Pedobacter schmidteae]